MRWGANIRFIISKAAPCTTWYYRWLEPRYLKGRRKQMGQTTDHCQKLPISVGFFHIRQVCYLSPTHQNKTHREWNHLVCLLFSPQHLLEPTRLTKLRLSEPWCWAQSAFRPIDLVKSWRKMKHPQKTHQIFFQKQKTRLTNKNKSRFPSFVCFFTSLSDSFFREFACSILQQPSRRSSSGRPGAAPTRLPLGWTPTPQAWTLSLGPLLKP